MRYAKLDLYSADLIDDSIVVYVDGLSDPIVYDVINEVMTKDYIIFGDKKYILLNYELTNECIILIVEEIKHGTRI